MTLYLIAFFGVLFHLVTKYRDSWTKRQKFDWKYQIVFTAFSIPTAFIIVYFKDPVLKLLGVSFMDNPEVANAVDKVVQLLCFFLGYWADSIWKNVESTGRSKLNIQEETLTQASGGGNDTIVQPENPSEPRPR